MAIRSTQQVVEVLEKVPNPNARLTQVVVEVLTKRRTLRHGLFGAFLTAPVKRIAKTGAGR